MPRLAVPLRSLNRELWSETARIVESILLAVNPIRPFAQSLSRPLACRFRPKSIILLALPYSIGEPCYNCTEVQACTKKTSWSKELAGKFLPLGDVARRVR